MLILRRQYHNLLGESIRLDIYRYSNCCHLVVTRNNHSKRCLCVSSLATIALFILILSIIISLNIQKYQDFIIVLFAALLFLILIFYWRSPIIEESIILLDNVSGIETTKRNIFGEKRSSFITADNIVINEAITMHRVIYYLVAIPPSLTSTLLSSSRENTSKSDSEMRPNNNNRDITNNRDNNHSRNKLIPLFCNTCPRLDCLKVMYQHIQQFKRTETRLKRKEQRDGNGFRSSITSFKLNKRKNGFRNDTINSFLVPQ